MRLLFTLLLTLPLIIHAQQTGEGQLWRSAGIVNLEGKPMPNPIEAYVIYNEKSVYLCNIAERMDRVSGEMNIEITVDTLVLQPMEEGDGIEAVGKNFALKFEVLSKDDLRLYSKSFYFAFKLMEGFDVPKATLSNLSQALQKHPYIKTPEASEKSEDNLIRVIKNNTILYQRDNDAGSWESQYKLFDFNGYLIFKGITSPGLLLRSIEEEAISFYEIDNRFDPKPVVLRKYAKE